MAKFTDGTGAARTLAVRDLGHLEAIQDRHGVAIDTVFMEGGGEIGALLFGNPRRLGAILADLAGLAGDEAAAFARALDRPALDRGRAALLEAVADFCLPPLAGAKFKEQIPQTLDEAGPPAGSSKATSSAA